ncbi:MAG: DNA mismatch repair protein MutS [Phycisphaerales bacterium]|nr:MAG: DNA mismatch repair protein MutS [Phycisphaerales bacterium]
MGARGAATPPHRSEMANDRDNAGANVAPGFKPVRVDAPPPPPPPPEVPPSEDSASGDASAPAPAKPKGATGKGRDTPAMRQYFGFKERYPGCVLFFRMGDFYEMFDEDAVTAHKALGITLTERTPGVPMAGVPYHAVETYLRRMVEQGYRVAVCEQVQDPRDAKGVVDRAVSRVLTAGTVVDDALLRDDRSNNLACVAYLGDDREPGCTAGVAIVELSTGSFRVFECLARDLADELARRAVTEVLYCEPADGAVPERIERLARALGAVHTGRPAWQFRRDEALEALRGQWRVRSLQGFGLREDDPFIGAAGALVFYLRETQTPGDTRRSADRAPIPHLSPPRREESRDVLRIDAVTLRSLEIERTMRDGALDGSLLGVFMKTGGGCRTPMGKRLLRDWLCAPCAHKADIESRQACVATLVEDRRASDALGEALGGVQDVARIAGRVALGRATPRDVWALGRSLSRIDALADPLGNSAAFAARRESLLATREALAPLAEEIGRTCVDSPPSHLREGGLVRDGVDATLDETRSLQRDASDWLAKYQQRLLDEHRLSGLKVGYNKVFGYFIELTSAQARHAPDAFKRTQSLKNAERYTTPELKEFEEKVLTARDRAIAREQAIFDALCAKIAAPEVMASVARFAQTVAEVDALRCFAERAVRRGWTRPTIADEPTLDIAQGRHPVLEELLGEDFVPNDAALATRAQPGSLALITGPNMAGKSTYIRQCALLTILAHTGSYIPAERATIGLCDRVFTRVGADDALHAGQSTFMVEMTETANILHHATGRSLVILDEIGRGTSTLDGLSLAWAIAERLAQAAPLAPGDERAVPTPARTLFATHYHELTQLEETTPGRVVNLHVAVREWGDEIVFLHRILTGRTDRSYGVQVARLAGIPADVIERAKELLESLAVSHEPADLSHVRSAHERAAAERERAQMSLFTEYLPHPVVEELKRLDLESMTPMQAFDALRRLRDSLEE